MAQLYDQIGSNYRIARQPDPFVYQQIIQRLGSPELILNVGAGAGSYEPRSHQVVAVEPSFNMIKQRSAGAAPAVQAVAEALPFRDETFVAAMTVLSCHHWKSRPAAFEEIGRVTAGKAVFVTWDPAHEGFWLTRDYFPEILDIDQAIFPEISEFDRAFSRIKVYPLLIPHDCTDGFLGAYWRRPQAYLDDQVRGSMSTFSKIGNVSDGVKRLRDDLKSGIWSLKNDHLLKREKLDLGYRILVVDVDE